MTIHELIAPRLAALRAYMADQEIDAIVIPHDDEHLGEYIPPEAERLRWISGFTGSAGVAVILSAKAALFVDGRYTVQARQQTSEKLFEILHLVEQPHMEWLLGVLQRKQKVP